MADSTQITIKLAEYRSLNGANGKLRCICDKVSE